MNFKEKAKEWRDIALNTSGAPITNSQALDLMQIAMAGAIEEAYEAGKAEASELVEALEFYAEERHHNDDVWSSGTKLDDSTMEKDWGKQAREALKKWRGE